MHRPDAEARGHPPFLKKDIQINCVLRYTIQYYKSGRYLFFVFSLSLYVFHIYSPIVAHLFTLPLGFNKKLP